MPNALEVDVTAWLIARLTSALAPTGVDADTPAALTGPFVRVVRVGGGDDSHVLDRANVVFHCFALTGAEANQLAYQLRGALAALVGVVADGAVMTRAAKIGGPAWAPVENTALRHVVLTMQLSLKIA